MITFPVSLFTVKGTGAKSLLITTCVAPSRNIPFSSYSRRRRLSVRTVILQVSPFTTDSALGVGHIDHISVKLIKNLLSQAYSSCIIYIELFFSVWEVFAIANNSLHLSLTIYKGLQIDNR